MWKVTTNSISNIEYLYFFFCEIWISNLPSDKCKWYDFSFLFQVKLLSQSWKPYKLKIILLLAQCKVFHRIICRQYDYTSVETEVILHCFHGCDSTLIVAVLSCSMVLLREEGNCQIALYCSLKNNQVISTALSFLSAVSQVHIPSHKSHHKMMNMVALKVKRKNVTWGDIIVRGLLAFTFLHR